MIPSKLKSSLKESLNFIFLPFIRLLSTTLTNGYKQLKNLEIKLKFNSFFNEINCLKSTYSNKRFNSNT